MSEKDPVDENMINRLREYNAPYQPDAWDEFEEFRREKKDKRRPLIFFFRFAAGIAALFFVGWGVYKWTDQEKISIAVKQKTKAGKEVRAIEKPVGTRNSKPETLAEISGYKTEKMGGENTGSRRRKSDFEDEKAVVAVFKEMQSGSYPATEVISKANNPEDPGFPDFLQAVSFRYADIHLRKPFIPYVEQKYVEGKKGSRSADLKYSVGLSQNSNRASHVLPAMSFGLNGTTEIPLSKKVDFSTGFYVGRQSLRIQVDKPAITPTTAGTPQLDQVDYRWMSLEIPLHLRYNFSTAKKIGLTFAGGLALVGTTGQQSEYLYENKRTITTVMEGEHGPVVVLSGTIVETSVINKTSDRSKFDTGAALNFSMGLTYPVNRNLVAIEPFIKYPVGSVTAGNLNFMTWGLQMRWSAQWLRVNR